MKNNFLKQPNNNTMAKIANENWVTLSAKVEPEFRDILREEAAEKGFSSTSAYVRDILDKRHDANTDVSELHKRIFFLEAENAEFLRERAYPPQQDCSPESAKQTEQLQLEIRSLKKQKHKLQKLLNDTGQERNTLMKIHTEQIPHWLDKEGYQELETHLKKLKRKYPHLEYQQLLLDALKLVIKNESPFTFVRKLKDYSSNYKSKIQ